MSQVYKILKIPTGSNAYTVSREEEWQIVVDKRFDHREDAEQYVYTNNVKQLPQHLHERVRHGYDTYKSLLKDPSISKYLKYFLDTIDVDTIRSNLTQDGVKVL